jgi:AcrR family transcriptional regulator
MADVNTPRRRYSSTLRQGQAEATRRAVLDAARELFLTQGYGATTLDEIAARAGVSKPTVFSAVGNKQTVLKEVRDIAIAGDDRPIPIRERPMSERVRTEPHRQRAIGMLARHLTNVAARYAPVYDLLRAAAAHGEQEIQALWETEEHQRLTGASFWIEILRAKPGPRLRSTPQSAIDTLWLYMAPDHYTRLVTHRHWTQQKYRHWLTRLITDLFEPSDDTTH